MRRFVLPQAPASEQRRRYHDHVGGGWQADFTEYGVRAAESVVWNLGTMVVARSDFPGRRVTRPRALARADQLDHYELRVTGDGMRIDTERGNAAIAPHALVMVDMGLPFDTWTAAGRSIQVFLPREMVDEQLPSPRALHAATLGGPIATMLGDFLRELPQRLPSMSQAEATGVTQALLHLVAASASSTPETLERARPTLQATLLRQACRYIELHLEEPGLDAARVSGALGLSRSALYRLFEPYGGVAAHIIERRLHRIRDLLAVKAAHRPLAQLAEQHGFKSAAHFSRAFRAQFGCTPSEARGVAASSGNVPPCGAERDDQGDSLVAWLRPLRG